MPQGLKLFTGTSNRELAREVAAYLNLDLGTRRSLLSVTARSW